MKIDAHQHFWRFTQEEFAWIGEEQYKIRRDFLPQHLKVELQKLGIQGSIAVQARQSLEETRWLLQLAEKHPEILGVIGWVDLQSSACSDQLKEFSQSKWFKGVRHVVQEEEDPLFMLQQGFLDGVSQLQEYNLIYEILIQEHQLPMAIDFVSRFPKQPFVLDHMAKPKIKAGILDPWKEQIKKLAKFPNVSVKVSGMVTEADHRNWLAEDFKPFAQIIFETFGEDRILFGSDWPVCLLAASYPQVMCLSEGLFENNCLEAMYKLQGDNAMRVYRL